LFLFSGEDKPVNTPEKHYKNTISKDNKQIKAPFFFLQSAVRGSRLTSVKIIDGSQILSMKKHFHVAKWHLLRD